MKRTLLAAIFVTSLAAFQAWGQDDIRPLTILHVNDLHAQLTPTEDGHGGFAYLAAEMRHQRQGCAACLFLNAGDLVQGTPVSTIYRGSPVYELANMLGFDAATVGNHEFDYGWRTVRDFAHIAHFPLLSANVQNNEGQSLTGADYVVITVGGLRVGIIGLVMGDLKGNYATPEQVGPWDVRPVAETIHRLANQLKDRADIIVALGHLNITEAPAILSEAPEVSVAVLGHLHDGYAEMQQVDHRYAVQEKAYGVELGRLDMRYDLTRHQIVSAAWKHIPIDSHAITPAPDVATAVAKWESKVSHIVDVPIGQSKHPFTKDQLRPMIEQAMAEATGADFAFITTGDVRATLPQGTILARHIWNMLPFENDIVVGTFKGRDLPPAITSLHPVDPDREYKVAVTQYLAINQSSPNQLGTTGMKFPVTGPKQRDAMLAWVKKKKVLE